MWCGGDKVKCSARTDGAHCFGGACFAYLVFEGSALKDGSDFRPFGARIGKGDLFCRIYCHKNSRGREKASY